MTINPRHGGGGFGRLRPVLGMTLPAATVILAAAALGGCYAYVPAEPEVVPAGSHVRLEATGIRGLEGTRPGRSGSRLEGRLLPSPTRDTLFFAVALLPTSPETATRGLRSTVAVAAGSVSALEVRKLDRTRTGALIGGGVLLAAVVLDAAFDIRNGTEGNDDPGGVDNAVVPLFRLTF